MHHRLSHLLATLLAICISEAMAQVPLETGFVRNDGQLRYTDGSMASDVLYRWRSKNFNILFYEDKFSYEFQYSHIDSITPPNSSPDEQPNTPNYLSQRITFNMTGQNEGAYILGLGSHSSPITYESKTTLPPITPIYHDSIRYVEAFPGTDITFYTDSNGGCKYDITVRPGGRLSDVGFLVSGVETELITTLNNTMTISFQFGTFNEHAPISFLESNSEPQPINISYSLTNNVFNFVSDITDLDEMPPGTKLIIDPIGSIIWSTYFSSTIGTSYARRIRSIPGEGTYVAGTCFDAGLVTTGVPFGGFFDVWIAKFTENELPWQTADLVWCTVAGGPLEEWLADLDVCNGTIAVGGWSASESGVATDGTLIDMGGGGDNHMDGFLMFFNTSDGARTFGTYIGGVNGDYTIAVQFDCRPGNTISCYALSNTRNWPIDELGTSMENVWQDYPLSPTHDRVTLQRYDVASTTLEWTTFYSTTFQFGSTWPSDLTVDLNGNPIILCRVSGLAPNEDLGITHNSPSGSQQYVIASFRDDGGLNWARWYGTGSDGMGLPIGGLPAIQVNPNNDIYVSGYEWTPMLQTYAYISKIQNNPFDPTELWRVELPGYGSCSSGAVRLSPSCIGVIAIGQTDCLTNYSTDNAHQLTHGGGTTDGFILEIEDHGTTATISSLSYFGGTSEDIIEGCEARDDGFVFICGSSQSGLPGVSFNGNPPWEPDPFNGAYHAFISGFNYDGCCPADISIPDGHTTSEPTTYSNQTLRIEGTWYIDANVVFEVCTLLTMPGAEIIIGSSGTPAAVHMEYSEVRACSDMWRGFVTKEGAGSMKVRRSSISDAQYAVQLSHNTSLDALHVMFKNNYVGVYLPPPQGNINTVTLILDGCHFFTAGSLVPPYQGQVPAPSTKGYAGLNLNNTVLYLSSNPLAGDNVFNDLNYGILMRRTTLTLINARFSNIQPDEGYGMNSSHGAAIKASGFGGYFGLRQYGKGLAQTDPLTFHHCKWGIHAESMNLLSTENKLQDVVTGYRVSYGGGRSISIRNNDIDVLRKGIQLLFNDGAALIRIQENTIRFGTNQNLYLRDYGIGALEINGNNSNAKIEHNTITHRQSTFNAWAGIHLSSVSGYQLNDNTITLSTQIFHHFGINLNGCDNLRVACNAVNGQGGWQNNWSFSPGVQAGIRHSMGDNNRLSCNSVSLLRQGITFNGYSAATVLEGNTFGLHDKGLLLTQGALIGPQVARGNIWNGVSATMDAEWIGPSLPLILSNPVLVNQILNPLCMPNSFSPQFWFDNVLATNFECAIGLPQCETEQVEGGGGERDQATDEAVMQGIIQNGIYTDETQLTLAYELYRAMLRDSALYVDGPYTADFIAWMAASIAEQLRNVEEPRRELYGLPPAVSAAVEQNELDIALLMAQIAGAQDLLATGSLTPAQITSLEAEIAAWKQGIETMALYNQTAIANVDAARVAEAMLLESGTGNIASTALIEQNARAVNEIYLATIARSGEDVSFDAAQASTLLAIAEQCPLLGGNPVYQARSLCSLIDDELDFDDALICIADGFVVKSGLEHALQVKAYPNPNRTGQQFFEVSGLNNGVDRLTIILYDTQGRPVVEKMLAGPIGSVDVSSLSQGLYHWTVLHNGQRVGHGKVTLY